MSKENLHSVLIGETEITVLRNNNMIQHLDVEQFTSLDDLFGQLNV